MALEPAASAAQPPKIIALAFDDDGDVLVTWSLPGLNRAVVRMAYTDWLEGRGLAIGPLLAAMLPPPAGASAS